MLTKIQKFCIYYRKYDKIELVDMKKSNKEILISIYIDVDFSMQSVRQ